MQRTCCSEGRVYALLAVHNPTGNLEWLPLNQPTTQTCVSDPQVLYSTHNEQCAVVCNLRCLAAHPWIHLVLFVWQYCDCRLQAYGGEGGAGVKTAGSGKCCRVNFCRYSGVLQVCRKQGFLLLEQQGVNAQCGMPHASEQWPFCYHKLFLMHAHTILIRRREN